MPIPSRPWDVISMDFIVDLPPSKGYNTLMVVVDFFSKQAHFIPAKPPLTSNQVAQLFFKYILSIMDYQKSSCLTGILGSQVDFGKSCSRFWARNFVCQHRHILKQMDRLSGWIKASKIICVVTSVVTSRRINQIGWSMLTCLSSTTTQLSTHTDCLIT